MNVPLLLWAGVVLGSAARAEDALWLEDPVVYPPEVFEGDPVGPGEIRVSRGDGVGALVLEHTSILAEIHAGLARVTLLQWFRNPYEEPIEATYLLPLPSLAAVDSMELVCGDRVIAGMVMERERARGLYEAARADGYKAALLEQQRDNLFTQRIANLCPGESVQVTIQYTEQVSYEDGIYALALPLTVGPRYSPPWVSDAAALETPYERTGHDVDITVAIEEGMPVASLWSESHDVLVAAEEPWGAEVVLAAGDAIPNRDFELSWALAGEQPKASVVAHRPDPGEPGVVAVTIEPPVLAAGFVARPRELLFVIDSSCSMTGEPYKLARDTVMEALSRMGPGDTFNLVRFSDEASSLFERPQPASDAAREQAAAWFQHFDGGGTEMQRGIVHALTIPGDPRAMRLVLMLTDGYIGGEDHMFATVRQHLGGARLFSLGIGESPNRYLLEGLAEMGRGDVLYQREGQDPAEIARAFYGRIAHPAMTDIRIDWGPDLEVSDPYPAIIPDLWAGQPVRVVARYAPRDRKARRIRTTVTVSGIVGTTPFSIDVPLVLPAVEPRHEAVATLWARWRIRDLEWYPRGRTPEQVRREILATALEHRLVSRYTSLVALDDEPAACGPAAVTVSVPHEAPAGMLTPDPSSSSGLLGAMGAQGRGSGSAGSGTGGGSFGAKPAGAITAIGGDPIVLGSVDRSPIDAVIKRHMNQIRYCYQRELQKNPGLGGKVTIRFTIEGDGTVSKAEVKSSTLGNSTVEGCLTGRFLRFQFPPPKGGGIIIVSYPILFTPG